MDEGHFKNKPNQEKLAIRVEIANPENWQEYKELRLLAITGADSDMFGVTTEEAEKESAKNEEDWRADLMRGDTFVVLSLQGSNPIGMGRVRKYEEEGVWSINSIYVKPESRGGMGKKLYLACLKEIQKRGGIKVEVGINITNDRSIRIAESLGFKHVMFADSKGRRWNELDLDLTDPEVISKINEV